MSYYKIKYHRFMGLLKPFFYQYDIHYYAGYFHDPRN
jgi:hypothetical protein